MQVTGYSEGSAIGGTIIATVTLSDGSILSFPPSAELSKLVASGAFPFSAALREALSKA